MGSHESKMQPKRSFSAMFGDIRSDSVRLLALILNRRRILDPPSYIWVEAAAKLLDHAWWKRAEEDVDFFGFLRNYIIS